MFYSKQIDQSQKRYCEYLKIVGSLSNLFSDSTTPYLYYRIAEKLFCDAFGANDLSRGDIALDAAKGNVGIGLKTFLRKNDRTLQKVAEFNKGRYKYEGKGRQEIIHTISDLRNKRITFAERVSGVESSIYHCVTRSENRFYLYEEYMDYIDIENIRNIRQKHNSIWFDDGLHEYSFNISKSTLMKRFNTKYYVDSFEVEVFENPLEEIQQCFTSGNLWQHENAILDTVYLPLYGKNKIVSEKSGLNQWNASGRKRDPNEIYIPIPSKVHQFTPDFFPARDIPFILHLPNGLTLDAKVCQDNSKALMSNPNKDLGQWLLRDVLKLQEGELLTYKKLEEIGIDSIRVDKLDNKNYKINFVDFGSFESYIEENENTV